MPESRIPKILHYCWLSSEPYPVQIQRCMESWREHLPDYEFVLWDASRFDMNSLAWTRQAFETGRYAFAADYIRLYALYRHGGIYLDSDVLLYRSFDDLLDLPYFIGRDFVGAFEPAVMGCAPGQEWLRKVMEYYEGRDFNRDMAAHAVKNLPVVFFERLFHDYDFKALSSRAEFSFDGGVFNLFDPVFFNGRDNVGPVRRSDSYCSHLFAGSWTGGGFSFRSALRILPRWMQNAILGLNYHVLRKGAVHGFDPVYRQSKR